MVPPSLHCAEGDRTATAKGRKSEYETRTGTPPRRRSARLQSLTRNRMEEEEDEKSGGANGNVSRSREKRRRGGGGGGVNVRSVRKSGGRCATVESGEDKNEEVREVAEEVAVKQEVREVSAEQMPELKIEDMTNTSDEAKVKATVRLFNKQFLYFVQEEEKRCSKEKVEMEASRPKGSKKASKTTNKGSSPEKDGKKLAKRPDLKAISKEYGNYELPLAVAIVLSGMYEDDLDNADDIVYTGQGGHNLTGDKRQIRDQVLERGNLALKNCILQNVPVRVIRGHESSSSYCGKVYTYDGLYKVVKYWAEKGISGFTVFKYLLRRITGQPVLTTNQVQFVYGRVPSSISELRGLVCDDITRGLEDIPIPATNLVDDPPMAPTGYKYIKQIKVAKNVFLPGAASGCICKGSCIDPRACSCAKLNGSNFPYVQRDGGRLIEAKDVVYECGPKCGCGPDCVNRVSQRGMRYRLEVFRAPRKGWAVRSWDFIPSGAPVCEYIGTLSRSEDMESALENNYIFDIDCLQTMRGIGGRERRSRDASCPMIDQPDQHDAKADAPEFCIDAGSAGNIARFINHSCEPNLFVQCVLSSHRDMKLARVLLFAADNIPPLQELTYDYGYALDSVLGPDGKVKTMACYCGATGCKKRLF